MLVLSLLALVDNLRGFSGALRRRNAIRAILVEMLLKSASRKQINRLQRLRQRVQIHTVAGLMTGSFLFERGCSEIVLHFK
jgi:hypothetical protein